MKIFMIVAMVEIFELMNSLGSNTYLEELTGRVFNIRASPRVIHINLPSYFFGK